MQTLEGQVFDRHLLGLRLIAKENDIDMPALFTDKSYAKSLHFCLSTSQVSFEYMHACMHASTLIKGILW